jgi:hypothetical protein
VVDDAGPGVLARRLVEVAVDAHRSQGQSLP